MVQKTITLTLVFVFIHVGIAIPGTIRLPQTGQTTCYDTEGNLIPCDGTGQDGDIRAGIGWPDPRLVIVYCDADGPCVDQSADCDSNGSTDMIKDNLTGLIWARNADLPNGYSSWQGALDYVAAMNNGTGLCGHHDWRLPNVIEMESLSHLGHSKSFVNWLTNQNFINVRVGYWSSMSRAADPTEAWSLSTLDGAIWNRAKNSLLTSVWPIRGETTPPALLWETGQKTCFDAEGNGISCAGTGQDGAIRAGVAWPDPRFAVAGGCVTDNLTGLMWPKNGNPPNEKISWQGALDYVAAMNSSTGLCGYHDWRLPNRKELFSLIDYSQSNPALPPNHPFNNVQSYYYWSSTSRIPNSPYAWKFHLGTGSLDNVNLKEATYYAWPVRSVPAGLFLPIILK